MIDDQVVEYSEVKLHEIKKKHESWVKDRFEEGTIRPLRLKSIKGQKTEFLFRIASGKQLFNMLLGACEASQNYPDPVNESEAELFASVFQCIHDYADIGNDLEAGARVTAGYQLSKMIGELEEAGFWLFGNRETKVLEGGVGSSSSWYTLDFSIVRCDDPEITVLDLSSQDCTST